MARTIRVIPAILTDNPSALETLVRQAESFSDYAQFDLMDGQFVPSQSISCADIAALKPKIKWEAHMMIFKPEHCLQDFKQAGAKKIVFHFEAVPSPREMVQLVRGFGMKVGLAVNPETSIDAFKSLVPEIDSVLFMAVHPGFYGAKFIPEVLDKIKSFRHNFGKMEIGIDGGIKESNIEDAARAGVDEICVGSAIFLQADPKAAYKRLVRMAQAAVI
jgi:ribulose-phosphate 3-epimerase